MRQNLLLLGPLGTVLGTRLHTAIDALGIQSATDDVAQALKANGISYMYQKFFGVPHGVGLAVGTNAEGWLEEAVAFWEKSVER